MNCITGQVSESVLYSNEEYSLCGVSGMGLFHPEDFGIIPISASTACWRGFQMGYSIENKELFLNWMNFRTEMDALPEINGISAQKISKKYSMFSHIYEGLALKSDFTGKLLIGKDFIREMYVHMGFQKPDRYKTVLEVLVEKGDITEMIDRSKDMEKIRNRSQPTDPEKMGVDKFVQDSFSLDYDF